MSFRDDRGAVDEHLEALKNELAGAREDLERTRARMGELEKELAGLRPAAAPASAPTPPPPAARSFGSRSALPVILPLFAAFAALLVYAGTRTAPRPPPPPAAVRQPVPAKTVTPTDQALAPPPPETHQATATWSAKVARSNGSPIAAGTACTVEATVEERADDLGVQGVVVRCGSTVLYDSRDDDAGAAGARGARARVDLDLGVEPRTFVLELDYHDRAAASRPEIALDSDKSTGSVWRYEQPAFRLDFALSKLSAPLAAEELPGHARAALRAAVRVVTTSGPAPVAKGTRCELRIAARNSAMCHVMVSCGKTALYGRGPFQSVAHCNADTAKKGTPLVLRDDEDTPSDDDPLLSIDIGTKTGTIADAPAGGTPWKVDFVLDEPDAGH